MIGSPRQAPHLRCLFILPWWLVVERALRRTSRSSHTASGGILRHSSCRPTNSRFSHTLAVSFFVANSRSNERGDEGRGVRIPHSGILRHSSCRPTNSRFSRVDTLAVSFFVASRSNERGDEGRGVRIPHLGEKVTA